MTEIKFRGLVFRQKMRTCNKPGCACHEGKLHGPYWEYLRQGERPVYVGKNLPGYLVGYLERLAARADAVRGLMQEYNATARLNRARMDEANQHASACNALLMGYYVADEELTALGLADLIVDTNSPTGLQEDDPELKQG